MKFCGKCGAKLLNEETVPKKISADKNVETVSKENVFDLQTYLQQTPEPKVNVSDEQKNSATIVQENSVQAIMQKAMQEKKSS